MPYRVRVNWTGAPVNGPTVTTLFFNEASSTAQQASDAAASLMAALDGGLSDELTWRTESEVDTLDTTTGELVAVDAVTPASGAGVNTAEVLPLASQGLLQWSTGQIVAGRVLKGRTFVPGFCENQQDAGAPTSAVIAQFNGFAAAFIALSPTIPVVWSRTHGVQDTILTGTLAPYWAVLRSRRD